MKKEEFNSLDIMEQIEYINSKLKLMDGNTLTKICKNIGVGRSTIRDRFKKVSYEYNKTTNQYQSIVEIIEPEIVSSEEEKQDINIVIQQSSNKVVGKESEKLNYIINNYDENLRKLNEMYNWYKLQSSNKVVETGKLTIGDFEGEVVVRSYKLYESVQKEFTEFCKLNNKYKIQDILSQCIHEFLEKYR